MRKPISTNERYERQVSVRRERDLARRQTKRTAEVWAMPADEVPTEEKGKYNTFFEVVADLWMSRIIARRKSVGKKSCV